MQDEIRDLREQVRNVHINQGNFNEPRANINDVPHDVTYGRTERY